MRQRQKSRQSSRGAGVEIVTIAEMQFLRDALERVSAPGTDPGRQAAVIASAARFRNAYYRTAAGCLRRVFPKSGSRQVFAGVAAQPSSLAIMQHFSGTQEGADDAADQSEAHTLRDQ